MGTIGSNIASFRVSKRWAQEKLASELGMTQSQISKIENDQFSPSWDLMCQIADKLDVSVSSLLPSQSNNIMYNQFSDQSCSIINQNNAYENEKKLLLEIIELKNKLISVLESKNKIE